MDRRRTHAQSIAVTAPRRYLLRTALACYVVGLFALYLMLCGALVAGTVLLAATCALTPLTVYRILAYQLRVEGDVFIYRAPARRQLQVSRDQLLRIFAGRVMDWGGTAPALALTIRATDEDLFIPILPFEPAALNNLLALLSAWSPGLCAKPTGSAGLSNGLQHNSVADPQAFVDCSECTHLRVQRIWSPLTGFWVMLVIMGACALVGALLHVSEGRPPQDTLVAVLGCFWIAAVFGVWLLFNDVTLFDGYLSYAAAFVPRKTLCRDEIDKAEFRMRMRAERLVIDPRPDIGRPRIVINPYAFAPWDMGPLYRWLGHKLRNTHA